jgi:uncharacterized membrane protein
MMPSKNMSFVSSRLFIWIVFCIALIAGIFAYGHSQYEKGRQEGTLAERFAWSEKFKEAERKAINDSIELQRAANQAAQAKHDYDQKLLAESQRTTAKLSKALADARSYIVPAAAVQLLNDSQHSELSSDAGLASQSSATTAAIDSTLEEQLIICQRNYQERYLPLAEQTRQLQSLWLSTQRTINLRLSE